MEDYNFIFNWLKNATKEQRHIDEVEAFAKKHPIIFMKFHKKSKGIVANEENSEAYMVAKSELTTLFNENKEVFEPVFQAIKTKFSL